MEVWVATTCDRRLKPWCLVVQNLLRVSLRAKMLGCGALCVHFCGSGIIMEAGRVS